MLNSRSVGSSWLVLGLAIVVATCSAADVLAQQPAPGASSTCRNEEVPPDPPTCPPRSGGLDSVRLTGQSAIGRSQSSGSLIGNINFRYRHFAYDYRLESAGGGGGCSPCGGSSSGSTLGELPLSLEIKRCHMPEQMIMPSIFGAGCGWQYDIWPTFPSNGQIQIREAQAIDYDFWVYDANADGIFEDTKAGSIKDFRVFDASGNLTTVRSNAITGKMTTKDGFVYDFEFVQLANSSTKYGRLTKVTDRNGTWIEFKWKYANLSQTGANRTKYFILQWARDAYLKQINFTYNETTQFDGKWCCTGISLPNGQSLTYSYTAAGGPNGQGATFAGLQSVTHPDGSVTTFSRVIDSATQCVKWSIFDPAAEPTHRKKEIYLSQNTFVNPATGQQQPQSSNRIRMAKNGAGELTYFNWSGTVAGSDVSFIYNGGNSLVALVIDRNASVNYARPTAAYTKNTYAVSDLNVIPANWNGWTMQYSGVAYDSMMRRTAKSDALGRTELFQIDPTNGAVTQTTHFDSTTSSSTFNAFFQPLVVTDRLGRVTKNEYDVKGNAIKKTEAFGTPLAGVWEWTFNTRGQPLTAKDANGNVTDYAYYEVSGQNGFRRLKSITEPADTLGAARAVTQFEYDAAGRLIKTTDPTGRQTVFAYDGRNRRISITYYDTSTETFTYGSGVDAGLLVEKKDRDGAIEKCVFDGHGRQTSCTTAFGTPVATVRSTTYLSGTELPLSVTVNGETTSFGYDNENKRITVARQVRGGLILTSTTFYDVEDRQSHVSDPYGRKTYVVYDINDRVSRTIQETVPNALTVPAGQAARDTYLNGLTRNLGPNATYLISDASYDAQGQLLTQTDPRGVVRKTTYDARGRTFEQFEAFGTPEEAKTQMVYDPQGNALQILSPRHFTEAGGFITEMTYTARNLLATRTVAKNRPEQATESWTYFLDRQEQNHVDFRGNTSTKSWGWCCARLQGTITPPASVDTSGVDKRSVRTMRYSFAGDLTHSALAKDIANVTFPTGQNQFLNVPDSETLSETTTKFDARHRPVATTRWLSPRGAVNPDSVPIAGDNGVPASEGLTTRWTYDDNLTDGSGIDQLYAAQIAALGPNYFATGSDGSAVQITNPAGETSTQFFDALGRSVMTIDALGRASRVTYDIMVDGVDGIPGSVLTMLTMDSEGRGNTTYTDGAGRTILIYDAQDWVTSMQYDAQGNMIKRRDPNGTGEDNVYDARGRRTQSTDTENAVTKWTFDAHSNITASTDAKNFSEVCLFDGRDRKIQCTDRMAGVTKFEYDPNSNQLSIEDAEAVAGASGKKTLYVYDARNLISESFPGHVPASLPNAAGHDKVLFNYDAMDRTITKIDQKGESTGFVFDLVGRLMTRSYPDNANDTFTYDTASRMLTAQSARYSNLVTRSYNATSTLASESLSVAGKTYTVQYGYDNANRNTSITYPSGKVVTRGYSTRDDLESVTYDNASVITRTYDAGRRLTGTTYGNSKVESRTYRNDNLLSTLATPGVTALSYAWDANKNKTSETDTFVNAYSWTTGSGGYDSLDRLVSWSRTNGNAQSWNLSPVGNWNNWTYNGNQENRTHNAVHEITSNASRQVDYDPKGNMTYVEPASGYYSNSGVTSPTLVETYWNYTWDYDNRMVSAISEGGDYQAQFKYDALGRRISKANSSQQTIYVSSLQQEIAEYVAGANANAPTYEYVFGSYIDEVLMRVTSSSASLHYYHHDAQYCVRSLNDSTGALVERYAYDPYGRPIYLTASGALSTTQSSSVNNTILYTGRRLDTETGLYYFRARYQDPVLGRFLSRDPIGFEGSKWNLYEYVDSVPTIRLDPSGHAGCTAAQIAGCQSGECKGKRVGNCQVIKILGCNVVFCDCQPSCKPCSPAAGTIGWKRTDTSGNSHHNKNPPPNRVDDPTPHMHVMQVNQRLSDCKCFWNAVDDVMPGANRGSMPDANVPVTGGGT